MGDHPFTEWPQSESVEQSEWAGGHKDTAPQGAGDGPHQFMI